MIYTLSKLSGIDFSHEEIERAVRGTGPAEWPRLIRAAELHCLVLPIHKRLSELELIDALPAASAKRLCMAAAAASVMTTLLLNRHAEISAAAARAGVPLMPLKGAHLCGRYYADGERAMSDLDYIVPPGSRRAASELMLSLGYERLESANLSREFEDRYSGEEKFRRVTGKVEVIVEIHTRFIPSDAARDVFPLDENSFFRSAKNENNIPVPRPEHAMLFGTLHLAVSHLFSRMMWLSDTDRLARADGFDWRFLFEEAKHSACSLVLFHALAAAVRLYRTPLPENVRRDIRAEKRMLAASRVDSWISGSASSVELSAIPFLLCRKPAALLARRLFPSPEFVMLRYGVKPALAPAWYVMRPFALAAAAFKTGFRSSKRSSPGGGFE